MSTSLISTSITSVRLTSSCQGRQGRGWSTHSWHQGLTIVILCYMAQLTRTLPDYSVLKNTAARLIMRVAKYSNITPVLKGFAVGPGTCLFQDNATRPQSDQLSWINVLACPYLITRSLRSEGTKQLKRPKRNGKAGDASFPAAAPDLWNRPPFSVRGLYNENSFKNTLKTLYFRQYFGWCSND